MGASIKLNDLLRLTEEEIARTKVRLNADYDGEDAVEVYRRDPERALLHRNSRININHYQHDSQNY